MSEPQIRKTFRVRLDEMITILRGEIATGKRQPGEFLPSERDLVRQFQLSNKLVRVALEQLVSEGLVVKIPRVGNKVAETSDTHPISLRFGYHTSLDNEADMAILLAEFHRLHPNIIVKPIPLTYHDYYSTVREYIETGLIDVVSMNYNNFLNFQSNNSLNLFEAYEPDSRMYPFLNEVFVHEGVRFVQPFIFSPLILCYNRDHLRESGIAEPFRPASWNDLLAAAMKLTVENERFGLYFFLLSTNRWPVFLLQSGVELLPDRSNIEECAERIMEGLSACRDILYADNAFPVFLSESNAVAEELFLNGKISMLITSYFALSGLRDSDIRFDLAPLPHLREDKTLLMTIGLAICKKSKAKVAARTLVDFLVSEHAQLLIRQNSLSIPVVQKAAEWIGEETSYRPPHHALYRDIVQTYRSVSDMRISMAELEVIIKEARLFWAKLNNETVMRERIAQILRHGHS
jgi:multiple sugar transport system substrate-binding protein